MEKTNAMRILEQKKLAYTAHTYNHKSGVAVPATEVAKDIGVQPERLYKTLVTQGTRGGYFVFVIPAGAELHLKKAAAAVGEKAVTMLPVAKLLQVTGYVRGGCSPVGMKKQYVTVFHSEIMSQETVLVSAGKIGFQIETSPQTLLAATGGEVADITQ